MLVVRKNSMAAKAESQIVADFFAAIEQDDIGKVKATIRRHPNLLHKVNLDGFSALDVATMLNHCEIAEFLLRLGLQESAKFSASDRLLRLEALFEEALTKFNEYSTERRINQGDEMLSVMDSRVHRLKKMIRGILTMPVPSEITGFLTVGSLTSLVVTFGRVSKNQPLVTKYYVEWSMEKDFRRKASVVIWDLQRSTYVINGLQTGRPYFVRVAGGNFKGFGKATYTCPACLSTSSWHEVKGKPSERNRCLDALSVLYDKVKLLESSQYSPYTCTSANDKAQTEKRGGQLSFKNFLLTTGRLHKSLKGGFYLSVIIYQDSKVLCTLDDQIPTVQVDSTTPTSINALFQWFLKLSCCHAELPSIVLNSEEHEDNATNVYQAKLFNAVRTLKVMLGQRDLGVAHLKPIVDQSGNVIFLFVKSVDSGRHIPTFFFKWTSADKYKRRYSSLGSRKYKLDYMIFRNVEEYIQNHKMATDKLDKGLYVGYLKLECSLNEMKLASASRNLNTIPYAKVRSNPHVSREEWDWLHSTEDWKNSKRCLSLSQCVFAMEIMSAVNALLKDVLGLEKSEMDEVRIYRHELVEINANVTFVFLLPPEQIAVKAHDGNFDETDNHMYPVKVFETANLRIYNSEILFKVTYMSVFLDIYVGVLRSLQRKALEDQADRTLRSLLNKCTSYQSQLENAWKSARWIGTIISGLRENVADARLTVHELDAYLMKNEFVLQKLINNKIAKGANHIADFDDFRELFSQHGVEGAPDLGYDSDDGSGDANPFAAYNMRRSHASFSFPSIVPWRRKVDMFDVAVRKFYSYNNKKEVRRAASIPWRKFTNQIVTPYLHRMSSCKTLSDNLYPEQEDNKSDVKINNNEEEANSHKQHNGGESIIQRDTYYSMENLNRVETTEWPFDEYDVLQKSFSEEELDRMNRTLCLDHLHRSSVDFVRSDNDLSQIDKLYMDSVGKLPAHDDWHRSTGGRHLLANSSTRQNHGHADVDDRRTVKIQLALSDANENITVQIPNSATAREVVRQVAEEGHVASTSDGLCLVVVLGCRERCLRDDYPVLSLQNPWKKGKLFIRKRSDLFSALERGNEAAV